MASTAWEEYLKSRGVNPATGATAPKQTTFGTLGDIVGTLGQLDSYQRNNGALSDSNNTLNNQISYLQDMYNPNGAVAQQLNAELSAKDAAMGRNSQYAQRSIALQAALAKGATQNAQTIQSLVDARNKNAAGMGANNASSLASLLSVLQNRGVLQKADNYVTGGLSSMYDKLFGNSGGAVNQPMSESVYGGGGNYGGYTTGSNENFTGAPDSVPMSESPYSNYGGNYMDYTTGSDSNPVYNQASGTDLIDDN